MYELNIRYNRDLKVNSEKTSEYTIIKRRKEIVKLILTIES